MSDCSQQNPEFDPISPGSRPELRVYSNEGRQWPSFNIVGLPKIDRDTFELGILFDLEPRPRPDSDAEKMGVLTNPRQTTRFILEAAEGDIEDAAFSEIFSKTTDDILSEQTYSRRKDTMMKLDNDALDDLYTDLFNDDRPRVLQLLELCRKEQVFTPEQFKIVVKYCVLAATKRNIK